MADLAKELEAAMKNYVIKNIVLTSLSGQVLSFAAFVIKFRIVGGKKTVKVAAEFTYKIHKSAFRLHNRVTLDNKLVLMGQSATLFVDVDVIE